ncbi:MAG TPA: 30S ribosomal protein S16 [bacterium]|nr:30S ribosomal protein S16 [bacterium]
MAAVLRLSRAGTHKRPYYWVVATDKRMPRDGRYLEKLGTYDPLASQNAVTLKTERIIYWLDQGARPSDAVREILRGQGVLKARAAEKAPKPAEEKPAEAPAPTA